MINTLYPPIQIGGAEKSVSLLAESLTRIGHSVCVATLHPEKTVLAETRNGVRVYRLPLANIYWPYGRKKKPHRIARLIWHLRDMWSFGTAKRIGEILDREEPDVVHINTFGGFSPSIFREVKRRGIRLIHTLRDYDMLCSRAALYRDHNCEQRCKECVLMTLTRKASSANVDAVVSNSQYVLDRHRQYKYFSHTSSNVIFNIADLSSIPAQVVSHNPTEALTFGYIGRVEPEKGIEIVLEAFRRLRDTPGWRLRIAGSGLDRYVEELKRGYDSPNITWLGTVPTNSFYPSIDVTIISSVWPEPLPRTLIETFAFGKSAICSDAGGIPEMSTMGRVVATYCATEIDQLEAALRRALDNPIQWKTGGFKNGEATNEFAESTVVRKYLRTYATDLEKSAMNVRSLSI